MSPRGHPRRPPLPTGRTMRRSCLRGAFELAAVRPTVRPSVRQTARSLAASAAILCRFVHMWQRRGFSAEDAPEYYGGRLASAAVQRERVDRGHGEERGKGGTHELVASSMSDVPDLEKASGGEAETVGGASGGSEAVGLEQVVTVRGGSRGRRQGRLTCRSSKNLGCARGVSGGQETNLGVKLDHAAVMAGHAWGKKKNPLQCVIIVSPSSADHRRTSHSHLISAPSEPPPPPAFFPSLILL